MRVTFFCLVIVLTSVGALAQSFNPGEDAVFRPKELAIIKLTLAPEAKAFLLDPANSESEDYFPAGFHMINSKMDTVLAFQVGVRLRGNTSRQHEKKAFKIDFREYDGSKFFDYKKFNLKPNVNDPSQMREPLTLLYYRAMDVPAARTHPLKLYMNDEYMGVYSNVEQVDDEFLNKRHGHEEGFLYKCSYGANLTDNGQVFNTSVFESEINEGNDTRAELNAFVKVLNNTAVVDFKTAFEKVFEVDTYLKQLAVEALLGHWDGYSYNQNNFYLFYNGETKKFEFFPYDADNTWGIDWVDRDWATRNLDVWYNTGQSRPLTSRILQDADYKRKYVDYLRELLELYFNEAYLNPQLEEHKTLLSTAILEDTYFGKAFGFTHSDFLTSFATGMTNHVEYGLTQYLEERTRTAIVQVPTLITSLEQSSTEELLVYPNPSQHSRMFIKSLTGSNTTPLVYSSTGKLLTTLVEKREDVMELSLPTATPAGLYIIRYKGQVIKWVLE